MKITIFTQDENVYLPLTVGKVVDELGGQVSCIVLASPMSTHGGWLKGLKRHLPLFGVYGSFMMAWRILSAKIRARGSKSNRYWSMDQVAAANNLPIYRVDKVGSDKTKKILEAHPAELLVSVSCPQILPEKVLEMFPRRGINAHSAPLPKYRGLMPGFWVLYHQEKSTAVTVHALGDKLDNGEIYFQKEVAISEGETWNTLIEKTKRAAGEALVATVRGLEDNVLVALPNRDEEATYFSFPTPEEAKAFRAQGGRMF